MLLSRETSLRPWLLCNQLYPDLFYIRSKRFYCHVYLVVEFVFCFFSVGVNLCLPVCPRDGQCIPCLSKIRKESVAPAETCCDEMWYQLLQKWTYTSLSLSLTLQRSSHCVPQCSVAEEGFCFSCHCLHSGQYWHFWGALQDFIQILACPKKFFFFVFWLFFGHFCKFFKHSLVSAALCVVLQNNKTLLLLLWSFFCHQLPWNPTLSHAFFTFLFANKLLHFLWKVQLIWFFLNAKLFTKLPMEIWFLKLLHI